MFIFCSIRLVTHWSWHKWSEITPDLEHSDQVWFSPQKIPSHTGLHWSHGLSAHHCISLWDIRNCIGPTLNSSHSLSSHSHFPKNDPCFRLQPGVITRAEAMHLYFIFFWHIHILQFSMPLSPQLHPISSLHGSTAFGAALTHPEAASSRATITMTLSRTLKCIPPILIPGFQQQAWIQDADHTVHMSEVPKDYSRTCL